MAVRPSSRLSLRPHSTYVPFLINENEHRSLSMSEVALAASLPGRGQGSSPFASQAVQQGRATVCLLVRRTSEGTPCMHCQEENARQAVSPLIAANELCAHSVSKQSGQATYMLPASMITRSTCVGSVEKRHGTMKISDEASRAALSSEAGEPGHRSLR